jgi:HEAT repeat protein
VQDEQETPPALDRCRAWLEDENRSVRVRAVVALAAAASPDAAALILGCLADPDPLVRATAAEALGELRPAAAVAPLVRALGDRDEGARDSAEQALARYGTGAGYLLCHGLRARDRYARERARGLLVRLGAEAVPRLLNELNLSRRNSVPEVFIALVELEGAGLSALCALLEHERLECRQRAAEALRERPDAAAVQPLCTALHSDDLATRAAAALAAIAEACPTPALRAALPLLKRRLAGLAGTDREVFRAAHRAIKRATETMKDLPLPAAAPAPDLSSLPRAGSAAAE